MINKPKMIGLVGYKGSGKTTVTAAAIKQLALNDQVYISMISFSDPILRMLQAFGVPSWLLEDKSKWDEPRVELCGRTIRHAAQTLGTEWGRDCIGDMLWTNRGLSRAQHLMGTREHVIFENVRFPSEFDVLTERGCIMIAFSRPDVKPDLRHSSEQFIADLQARCERHYMNVGAFDHSARRLASFLKEALTPL